MKYTFKFFQIVLLICGVFGVDADEVKKVSVMEGDSVTLKTDVTETEGIILILWRFGDKGSTIAQIRGKEISYPSHIDTFRGKLQLDSTGSLTIKNMRIKHSGLYKLQIDLNSGTSRMTFNVTVYESPAVIDAGKAEMKSLSVMEGESVTLQTDVTETHGDELIVWRFGDEGKLIAKHDIEAKSSPLHDTDERFRDRLKLDEKTGSLTITNTRTTDSGVYTVKISSNKQTLYKRFSVIISAPDKQTPDSGLSPGAVTGIVIVLLLVFAAAAAGVIYHRRKISELERQKFTNEVRNITVREGESLTLNPETEIQKDDQIQWRFGDQHILIAEIRGGTGETHDDDVRFTGRLKLDEKTGSLTITDMRNEDTGDYKLQISSSRGNTYMTFVVTVFASLKSVEEGKSVILKPDAEIQKDDQIQWMFGAQDILLAEIRGGTRERHDDDDGRFRGRLKLDEKTGSLFIGNMRNEHAGVYKLQISSSRGTTHKRFKVIVLHRGDKTVLEGKDVTLSSDTYSVKDEVNWFFNDEILAIGKDGDSNKTQYCDERFKDRLELDHQTGSLTIKNTRTSDKGFYHLKFPALGIERNFVVAVNRSHSEDDDWKGGSLKQDEEMDDEEDEEAEIVYKKQLEAGNRGNESATVEMLPLMNRM